jgi:hypothetical protein
MKKLISIILSILIIGEITYADDSKAIWVDEKDPAPFSGYLIKEERTVELLKSERESRTYQLLTESLEKSTQFQDEIIQKKSDQIKLLADQNDKLYKTAYDANTVSNWEKAAYFVLGALVTFGAFELAKGAIRQ